MAVIAKGPPRRVVVQYDLDLATLMRSIVLPWRSDSRFIVDGHVLESPRAVDRIRICRSMDSNASVARERAEDDMAMAAIAALEMACTIDEYFATVAPGRDHTNELLAHEPSQDQGKGEKRMAAQVTNLSGSLLFLDIVGWSALTPAQIRDFVERALPKLGERVHKYSPEMVNTWGDAIVAVFRSTTACAETALELCQFFHNAKASDGVVRGMSARVGMHVGEVFWTKNPITGNMDVYGPAVHTAARLEPVAAAGHAFCTAAFAHALGEVEGEAPRAHPIGRVALAKGYGEQEVFVVTATNAPAPAPGQFRAAAKYDELASLAARLGSKKVSGRSVTEWLTAAVAARPVSSTAELLEVLAAEGCKDVDGAFWHLMVAGVLEFADVNTFAVSDDYKKTAKHMRIADRGTALLESLRKKAGA